MTHDVFLSYSAPDQKAADAICKALEDAGVRCWIAPRNIAPGSHWGGSIVDAIQASKAVLVVFSEHSNQSPQVVREMECAVGKRLPLIPVRIADVNPTEDMQYFLGVSHWFNAFPRPIEAYLNQIVQATRHVLAGESSTWKIFARRLPQSRLSQGTIVAVAILVAIITAYLMRPGPAPNPMQALKSPMAGRWEAELPDSSGARHTCMFDVSDLGQLSFSDSCPLPYSGARGALAISPDKTYAPTLFAPGKDTGTFLIEGGALHTATGAFRIEGKNRLLINTAQAGPVTWKRIANDTPMKNEVDALVPPRVDWPLANVPAIAQRALAYARNKWQSDAFLVSVHLTLIEAQSSLVANGQSPEGPVMIQFGFYSPSLQQVMSLTPNSIAGSMTPGGSADPADQRELPANFMDLPQAVEIMRSRGMRAHQIKEAQLENWAPGTEYGSASLSGVEWMVDSALDERFWVPAAP